MLRDEAIKFVLKQLRNGNVRLAIAEMEVFLAAWPQRQTTERLSELKQQYELMEGYWRQGISDPQQEEQYQRLLHRMYVLYGNVAISRRMRSSAFLTGLSNGVRQPNRDWSVAAIRREMENFVSEVAMLELEPEHLRVEKSRVLYKNHQQQMNDLFNYVLTSRMWSDGVGRDFTELLLSPTVDSNDQQLITSAIMLSLMNQFDIVKFKVLTDVYRKSQDEFVRQRALVGWVFSMDDECSKLFPEQQSIINDLLQSDKVCKELTELQIQVAYTLNAEKDTTTIQREIMPDLLKNNAFHITRNGIEDTEDDALEDILHPDAAEQRMEKLESTFQRMIDMQKQGVDVYFGGFSQMKRYPFFYDLSNWLVPYYLQHPDIAPFVQKMDEMRFVDSLMQRGPFCNSDKYSFVIAFQEVVRQLPESMRQMMKRGEASFGEMEVEERHSAAYIRRIYLMDLYRLFRLFPNRTALHNPFVPDEGYGIAVCFFFCTFLLKNTPLDDYKHYVVKTLKKLKYEHEAYTLLNFFPESMRDIQYYLWKGDFVTALKMDPDNERALVLRASCYFDDAQYEEADNDYEHLLLLHPGKMNYMLNKAVCQVNLGEYEDALKLLYQLNYEHADDINIQRVLAWALTCDGNLNQADKMYKTLTALEHPSDEDFLNYGYCLWMQGKIDQAAENFRKHVVMVRQTDDTYSFYFEEEWLQERNIGDIQMRMMRALVFGDDMSADPDPYE